MDKKVKKKWLTPEVSYLETGEAVMQTESLAQGWDVPGADSGYLTGKMSSFTDAVHDFLSE